MTPQFCSGQFLFRLGFFFFLSSFLILHMQRQFDEFDLWLGIPWHILLKGDLHYASLNISILEVNWDMRWHKLEAPMQRDEMWTLVSKWISRILFSQLIDKEWRCWRK